MDQDGKRILTVIESLFDACHDDLARMQAMNQRVREVLRAFLADLDDDKHIAPPQVPIVPLPQAPLLLPATAPAGKTSSNDRNMLLDEAAERLGVTTHAVRKWIFQRRIPHVRLGRRVVIGANDLERFIQKHRVPAER